MPPAAPDRSPLAGAGDRIVRFAGRALGSRINLAVLVGIGCGDGDPDEAPAAAWDEVLDELAEVDASLSRFRDDSEVTWLNRRASTGWAVPVSPRLRVALATCHRARVVTGGRFDARMAETLERLGERGASLAPRDAAPPPRPVAAGPARRPVRVPPEPVDLGGIGKGLALRWAAARATRRVPSDAGLLLDAGGDLVAAGRAPEGGWLVGIEDPVATDPATAEPLAVVSLDRGALATSSVAVRRWTSPDGRPVHHLLDPRTREPARTGLIAVTVAAPDPAWAEVWTKALFLAGRAAIGPEARSRGFAAWWIDDGGCLGMTPEARLRSVWVDEARIG